MTGQWLVREEISARISKAIYKFMDDPFVFNHLGNSPSLCSLYTTQ